MLDQLEEELYEYTLQKQVSVATKRLFYFFIAYGFIFVLTFVLLLRTLNKLSSFYKSSLIVFGWVQYRYALHTYDKKLLLYNKFQDQCKILQEYIDSNEAIILMNDEQKKNLSRLRKPQIKKTKQSWIEDIKTISFMLFFIISGILLFISYTNNESHRQENQDALIQLANVTKILTSESERSTLAMLHAHYLMNKNSLFAKDYEKIFKFVIREPIRDIQKVLYQENFEEYILSFNTDKEIDKKLFDLLTKDSCKMIKQEQQAFNLTKICIQLYGSSAQKGYSFLKRSIFQETLDIFQKAENKKPRISWRQEFTLSTEFQIILFKYLFFKQQIEENIHKSIVIETKVFVNKQFYQHNGQLILLFQMNVGIVFTGILFSVIYFQNRIKLFMRNRQLLRLIPDQLICLENSRIASFMCKNTKIDPNEFSKRKLQFKERNPRRS